MPLRTLDASNNQLTGIPAQIGSLSYLQNLNLSNNKITTLPSQISLMTKLKILNLSCNPLSKYQINNLKNKPPNTKIILT